MASAAPAYPIAESRLTVRDAARRVYALHGVTSEESVSAFVALITRASLTRDAVELLARLLLDQERRNGNKPAYARAAALTETLTVERPHSAVSAPSDVRARVGTLEDVMTGDDQGKGYAGRRPISALRAFLDVKVKMPNRAPVTPGKLKREEMLAYAGQLERQGRGCFEHASLMRDLWAITNPGETGLTAVNRCEKGA